MIIHPLLFVNAEVTNLSIIYEKRQKKAPVFDTGAFSMLTLSNFY